MGAPTDPLTGPLQFGAQQVGIVWFQDSTAGPYMTLHQPLTTTRATADTALFTSSYTCWTCRKKKTFSQAYHQPQRHLQAVGTPVPFWEPPHRHRSRFSSSTTHWQRLPPRRLPRPNSSGRSNSTRSRSGMGPPPTHTFQQQQQLQQHTTPSPSAALPAAAAWPAATWRTRRLDHQQQQQQPCQAPAPREAALSATRSCASPCATRSATQGPLAFQVRTLCMRVWDLQ